MTDLMSRLHPALPPGPFDLRTLLQHEPPLEWKPVEEGDEVMGVCLRKVLWQMDYGEIPVVELIDLEGKIVRVKCSGVVLRKESERIRPGVVVRVVFLGKQETKTSGRTYRMFKVYTDQDEDDD